MIWEERNKMFTYTHSTGGNRQHIVPRQLGNSITAAIGMCMKTYDQDGGKATYGVAAQPILGILHQITDASYNPIVNATHTPGTAKRSIVASQATGTGGTYYCFIDASRFSRFATTVSGTLGTTNYSDDPDCRIDVNSANTTYTEVLETTATRTIGTPANFYSHGKDKMNTSLLSLSIAMSQLEGVKE